MAQWLDMEAEKSRTERMSVRDHPTWGWLEATDLSELTQRVKKTSETRDFYFLMPSCLPIKGVVVVLYMPLDVFKGHIRNQRGR